MPIVLAGLVAGFAEMAEEMKPFADAFPPENIRHHFAGQDQARGVYAKELRIPAGFDLVSHEHPYAHLSILASGSALWVSGGMISQLLTGPCVVTVEVGVAHSLHAVTDVVWFCIHPTDETDPAEVDAVILEGKR